MWKKDVSIYGEKWEFYLSEFVVIIITYSKVNKKLCSIIPCAKKYNKVYRIYEKDLETLKLKSLLKAKNQMEYSGI